METLFSILSWMGLIVFLVFLNEGAHFLAHRYGRSQGQADSAGAGGNQLRWIPPAYDRDPACGKMVKTDDAKSSVYAGNVHYFCSRECREVFEAAPDLYVGTRNVSQRGLEQSHA